MPSSTAALQHLKKIKPLDGWSLDKSKKQEGVRLLRRNVPLTDHYFLDLHYDAGATDAIVGILTAPRSGSNKAYGQVLVDAAGKPAKNRKTVSVTGWKATATSTTIRGTTTSRSTSGAASTTDAVPVLSDEQKMQLIKFGAMGIAGLVLLRFLLNAALLLYVLALPVLYFYLVQNCPSDESFDAKKELKRVMRGHHLPEDHPDKPKGFLSETLARLSATVTAEVATGLGYEITMISMAGAAKVACVRVPAAKMDYYWAGLAGRWYYVYSNELDAAS